VSITNPDAVAAATQENRRRCAQVARFLIDSVPGFAHARRRAWALPVGVRETRNVEAIYRPSAHDLAQSTHFEDGIVAWRQPGGCRR